VRDQLSTGRPAHAAGRTDAVGAPVPQRVSHQRAALVLSPRLAACYKIAMGIAMGYMLILML
jgi:hypothetical protein